MVRLDMNANAMAITRLRKDQMVTHALRTTALAMIAVKVVLALTSVRRPLVRMLVSARPDTKPSHARMVRSPASVLHVEMQQSWTTQILNSFLTRKELKSPTQRFL